MTKLDPLKKIQKHRTEEELRSALTAIRKGHYRGSAPAQDDDTDVVLQDCIEELMELRQLVEELKGFAQSITIKTARKY
jgi:hypothetical protein